MTVTGGLRWASVERAERIQATDLEEHPAGPLAQLAQSRGVRVLATADDPRRQLERVALQVVPVLADEYDLSVLGEGDDDYRGRVVGEIPIDDCPVWHAQRLANPALGLIKYYLGVQQLGIAHLRGKIGHAAASSA